TLAEYERELITERVNAGIAAAKQSGTRFGRPPVDPAVIAEKLGVSDGLCRGSVLRKDHDDRHDVRCDGRNHWDRCERGFGSEA
ncbi:recombinase family protein, partial [Janibacter melonis]|nr:recombinase family protein [Janibacter melonis]